LSTKVIIACFLDRSTLFRTEYLSFIQLTYSAHPPAMSLIQPIQKRRKGCHERSAYSTLRGRLYALITSYSDPLYGACLTGFSGL